MPRVKVDIVPGGFLALAADRIGDRWRLWRTLAAVVGYARNDPNRGDYVMAAVRAWIVRERLDLSPEDVFTTSATCEELATAAGWHVETVKDHMRQLVTLGVLDVVRQPGKNRATVYALEYPGLSDE